MRSPGSGTRAHRWGWPSADRPARPARTQQPRAEDGRPVARKGDAGGVRAVRPDPAHRNILANPRPHDRVPREREEPLAAERCDHAGWRPVIVFASVSGAARDPTSDPVRGATTRTTGSTGRGPSAREARMFGQTTTTHTTYRPTGVWRIWTAAALAYAARIAGLPPERRGGGARGPGPVRAAVRRRLARRYRGRGEPLEDLEQVARLGLVNAVDRYDPERGSFTAYAAITIVGRDQAALPRPHLGRARARGGCRT